ncbi:MAG: hypothetical protein GY859_32700 [Desulfobacterales bacterium]|nr:hypothetical protein [Desulfobacterales bacterium]
MAWCEDGLHQRAGNTDVIESHGNFAWRRCMDCTRHRWTTTPQTRTG